MPAQDELAQNSWFTIMGRGAALAGLPLLGWMALSIVSLQSDVKVLGTELSAWGPTRYSTGDALRDLQLRDIKIEALSMRLADLEHEVRSNKIEAKQQQLEASPRRR